MALETHGNDSALTPPTTPQSDSAARQTLSPADCRTLKKLLVDVRTPSPLASSTNVDAHDESLLSVDAGGDANSDAGVEDQVQYTELQYEHGDEREEGYEDEDDSMELSDVADEDRDDVYATGLEAAEEGQSMVSNVDDSVYVWSDGDTIEDIMNTPGKTAPPAPQLDLSGVYPHEQSTPDEVREIKARRAAIEKEVGDERLEQEGHDVAVIEDEEFGPDAMSDDEDDAVNLSDDPEIQAIEAVQAETGMTIIEGDEEAMVELEVRIHSARQPYLHNANPDQYFEPQDRRTSRLFSPKPKTPKHLTPSEMPLPSSPFPNIEPSVIPTPGGRHLEFTPNAAIPDTPFAKTLSYFKEHKGRDNSPSKSRRNASLPEEIAELAREANEEEEEDLDKYRDIDLAPMEPETESKDVENLITLDSPVKTQALHDRSSLGYKSFGYNTLGEVKRQQFMTPSRRLSLPLEQDEEDDADAEKSGEVSEVEENQPVTQPEDPTFVTVIGMLPEAMFWVAAAPVARLSNMAYDAVVEKITRMELE